MLTYDYGYYLSPIGWVELVAKQGAIRRIGFVANPQQTETDTPILQEAIRQLSAYFAGTLHTFSFAYTLEGTPFQQKVWQALLTIPYGEVVSYKQVAIQIGNANACRAVGGANNKNPLGIIVPCHRVIGSNNHLRGYATGIDKQHWLLQHEQSNQLPSISQV